MIDRLNKPKVDLPQNQIPPPPPPSLPPTSKLIDQPPPNQSLHEDVYERLYLSMDKENERCSMEQLKEDEETKKMSSKQHTLKQSNKILMKAQDRLVKDIFNIILKNQEEIGNQDDESKEEDSESELHRGRMISLKRLDPTMFVPQISSILTTLQESIEPNCQEESENGLSDFMTLNQFKSALGGYLSSSGVLSTSYIAPRSTSKVISDMMEEEEKELTFQPKTNSPPKTNVVKTDKMKKGVFQRLSEKAKRKFLSTNNQTQESREIEEHCTFKPALVSKTENSSRQYPRLRRRRKKTGELG